MSASSICNGVWCVMVCHGVAASLGGPPSSPRSSHLHTSSPPSSSSAPAAALAWAAPPVLAPLLLAPHHPAQPQRGRRRSEVRCGWRIPRGLPELVPGHSAAVLILAGGGCGWGDDMGVRVRGSDGDAMRQEVVATVQGDGRQGVGIVPCGCQEGGETPSLWLSCMADAVQGGALATLGGVVGGEQIVTPGVASGCEGVELASSLRGLTESMDAGGAHRTEGIAVGVSAAAPIRDLAPALPPIDIAPGLTHLVVGVLDSPELAARVRCSTPD